jgi:RNA polymerase sigma-70 factor (ECF subfamily)
MGPVGGQQIRLVRRTAAGPTEEQRVVPKSDAERPEEFADGLTDVHLVATASMGDAGAFALLMERYRLMALSLALRFVPDGQTAQDIVQDAMLQAFLSLPQLREPTRFKAWFYATVLSALLAICVALDQHVRAASVSRFRRLAHASSEEDRRTVEQSGYLGLAPATRDDAPVGLLAPPSATQRPRVAVAQEA